MKKKGFFWIRLVVSAVAIAMIVGTFRGRFSEVMEILRGIQWPMIILAFILVLFSLVMITIRLLYILRAQEVQMSYRNLFSLTMIGMFFNNFMPSAVGGDIIKGYFISKQTQKSMEPYTAIFTDRVVGYVTLISWSAIALVFYREVLTSSVVVHSVMIMLGIAVLAVLFFANRHFARPYHWMVSRVRSERWRDRLERLYDGVNSYRKHPMLMLRAMMISVGAQFFLITMNWVLVKGIGLNLSLGVLMLVLPIIAVAQMAPSINGMGVREGAYVFFLKDYITAEGALALALLFYLVWLTASLCGGVIYAMRGGVRLNEISGE